MEKFKDVVNSLLEVYSIDGYEANVNLPQSVVSGASDDICKQQAELYIPAVIEKGKGRNDSSSVSPGDTVLVTGCNDMCGRYTIAKVEQVFPGTDGKVRTVYLVYKEFRAG